MELPNFPHYIRDALRRELVRARRLHGRLACLLIAINDLSSVSEKYGYLQSDKILQNLGHTIRKNCRAIDIWGQDGKGKFLIMLPETNRSNAEIFTKRLVKSLQNISFQRVEDSESLETLNLDLSVGISVYPDPRVHSEDDLVALANEALCMAGEQGKTRVIVA